MFNRTIWLLFVIASVVLTGCKKEKLMLSPSDALVKSKTEDDALYIGVTVSNGQVVLGGAVNDGTSYLPST